MTGEDHLMSRNDSDGEFSGRVNKSEDRLTRLPYGKASDDMLGAGALHDVTHKNAPRKTRRALKYEKTIFFVHLDVPTLSFY